MSRSVFFFYFKLSLHKYDCGAVLCCVVLNVHPYLRSEAENDHNEMWMKRHSNVFDSLQSAQCNGKSMYFVYLLEMPIGHKKFEKVVLDAGLQSNFDIGVE